MGNFFAYSRTIGGIDADVAAAGGNQANATELTAGKNIVTSATATSAEGVRLPEGWIAGDIMYVANNTAVVVKVYPPVDGAIGGGTVNAAVDLTARRMAVLMSLGGGNWSITVDS
jgi:hypothetical protein